MYTYAKYQAWNDIEPILEMMWYHYHGGKYPKGGEAFINAVKDIIFNPDPYREEAGWDAEKCFEILDGVGGSPSDL